MVRFESGFVSLPRLCLGTGTRNATAMVNLPSGRTRGSRPNVAGYLGVRRDRGGSPRGALNRVGLSALVRGPFAVLSTRRDGPAPLTGPTTLEKDDEITDIERSAVAERPDFRCRYGDGAGESRGRSTWPMSSGRLRRCWLSRRRSLRFIAPISPLGHRHLRSTRLPMAGSRSQNHRRVLPDRPSGCREIAAAARCG